MKIEASSAPGAPEVCDVITPGILPVIACERLAAGVSRRSAELICEIAPTTDSFFCWPASTASWKTAAVIRNVLLPGRWKSSHWTSTRTRVTRNSWIRWWKSSVKTTVTLILKSETSPKPSEWAARFSTRNYRILPGSRPDSCCAPSVSTRRGNCCCETARQRQWTSRKSPTRSGSTTQSTSPAVSQSNLTSPRHPYWMTSNFNHLLQKIHLKSLKIHPAPYHKK